MREDRPGGVPGDSFSSEHHRLLSACGEVWFKWKTRPLRAVSLPGAQSLMCRCETRAQNSGSHDPGIERDSNKANAKRACCRSCRQGDSGRNMPRVCVVFPWHLLWVLLNSSCGVGLPESCAPGASLMQWGGKDLWCPRRLRTRLLPAGAHVSPVHAPRPFRLYAFRE